jgi:hypothetical protein
MGIVVFEREREQCKQMRLRERERTVGIVVFESDISVNVRSEVFTEVTMKNGVFWDVTPCGSCKKRRSGGA